MTQWCYRKYYTFALITHMIGQLVFITLGFNGKRHSCSRNCRCLDCLINSGKTIILAVEIINVFLKSAMKILSDTHLQFIFKCSFITTVEMQLDLNFIISYWIVIRIKMFLSLFFGQLQTSLINKELGQKITNKVRRERR